MKKDLPADGVSGHSLQRQQWMGEMEAGLGYRRQRRNDNTGRRDTPEARGVEA
jgi:hypothetical protein